MLFDLFNPISDWIERALVGDVVRKDDSLGTFVVGRRYGTEPFLSCSVSNLQFYLFAINLDLFYFEVDSNRRQMSLSEVIFRKTKEKASFADTWVPYYQEFKHKVVIILYIPGHFTQMKLM